MSWLTRPTPADQLIIDGTRNPILFLDYSHPFSGYAAPAEALGGNTFQATSSMDKNVVYDQKLPAVYRARLSEAWDRTNSDTMIVFALFARDKGDRFFQWVVVDFPLGRSTRRLN